MVWVQLWITETFNLDSGLPKKPGIWEIKKKKLGKTWNFEQKSLKNLELHEKKNKTYKKSIKYSIFLYYSKSDLL